MTEMRPDIDRVMLVAALAVALALAVPASGVGLSEPAATEGNATSGETLAGALTAHEADLQGDLERRELAVALEGVDGEAATAAVLAERRLSVERRAQRLAERRASLREARAAGDLSPAAYRVTARQLAARAAALRSLLAAVDTRSQALSPSLRSAYGLDDGALNRSRIRVDAATPGDPLATATPGESTDRTANLAEARNGTRRALRDVERRQTHLAEFLDRLADNGTDPALLQCGRERLADSRAATDRSRAALSDGETAAAVESLVTGATALRAAVGCLDGRAGTEAFESTFDVDRNLTTVDESDQETPTWDGTPTPPDEYDEKWTTTPTPTDTRTWEGKSTPTRGTYEYVTPTPSEDSGG